MLHMDSRSGSSHLVPNKGKVAIRDFPLYCGRNAPPLSEDKRRQLLASKRGSSENEKPRLKQNGILKIKEKDIRSCAENDMSHKTRISLQNSIKGIALKHPIHIKSARSINRSSKEASPIGKFQTTPKREVGKVGTCGMNIEWGKNTGKYKAKNNSGSSNDMAGSSKKGAIVTDGKDPKRNFLDPSICRYQLAERKENLLSSGSSKINSNLLPSGHNHKLPRCDFSDESYRERVVEAVSMFRDICNQLTKEKQKHDGEMKIRRIDFFAAKFPKEKCLYVHSGVKFVGHVPGVEVGDKFMYRMELAVVGLHFPPQNGIDYTSKNGKSLATSVVASKNYADDLKNPDKLIYVGEGGMPSRKKQPEDQKLVRGNRALMNSLHMRTPVRVIRQEGLVNTRTFVYVYDGLFMVESCEQDRAATGHLVYKFTLRRSPNQECTLPCKIKF